MSGSGPLGGVGLEWALWCDDDMADNGQAPQLQQTQTEVWVLGDNAQGQLGLGDRDVESKSALERLDTSSYIASVTCAENQTVLRSVHGVVWSCGENEHLNQGLPEEVADEGGAALELYEVETLYEVEIKDEIIYIS